MTTYRHQLPQLDAAVFLADGGLETSLIFDQGIDLPDFAAFPLLDQPAGVAALERYYDAYAGVAVRDQLGIVFDTATWRASPDWGARQGYGIDAIDRVNRAAVDLLVALRARFQTATTPIVISGAIGPRRDGYRADALMSVPEARAYHEVQVGAFAASDADLISALTMTTAAEGIGVALAARDAGMPVVISFTVETDGRLPDGSTLESAIVDVDDATDGYPVYFMINCAHPTHFATTLAVGAPWTRRLGGIRANASRMSHAELDDAAELDAGNPSELAEQYQDLRTRFPSLVVLGGCCGTNIDHIDAISATVADATVTAVSRSREI